MNIVKQMMPDCYEETVFDIDYERFYDEGIRYALFDVDSTFLPFDNIDVNENHVTLFNGIKNLGMRVALYSNGKDSRVRPVAEVLEVEYVPSAFKPSNKKFKMIKDIFGENFETSQTMFIGDSILCDMLFAGRNGMKKVLVDHIPDESFNFKGTVVSIIQVPASIMLKKEGFQYRKKHYSF